MTTSLDLSVALSRLTVISDAADDERDRRARREVLREVWRQCPSKLVGKSAARPYVEACSRWRDGASLVLLGPTRSGKSTAALGLVQRLLRDGVVQGGAAYALARGIVWTRADEVTRAGGAEGDESAERLLRRAAGCRLLVLDDVATPSKTQQRVIEQRYDRGLPIVLTSGQRDERGLARALGGDAVLRWVLESGRFVGQVVTA